MRAQVKSRFDNLKRFELHLFFLVVRIRMRGLVLVLGILVFLGGCDSTDPKDALIPARTQDLPHIQSQVKHLDDTERKLLAAYILRHTFSHGMDDIEQGNTYVLEGTTIGQAIDEQKRFVATDTRTRP